MQWLEPVLLLILALTTSIQLGFWGYLFAHLPRYRPLPNTPEKQIPVSIVICARNEEKNLRRHLPHWLAQTYRPLEIIVVNDASTDKSLAVLLDFMKKNPILRAIHIGKKHTAGKKAALAQGIAAASSEAILLTDADCIPASSRWVHSMVSGFRQKNGVVLGYSPYLHPQHRVLDYFIRFETSYVATQYFSFALAGYPYMGVGRNLMYAKSLFQQHGGFTAHQHLAPGDDDLFINQVAHASNTRVVLDPQAFTYSIPARNWRDYYYQKRRHLSVGSHYRPQHKLALGLLALSHFGHYASLLMLLVLFPTQWMWSLIAYSVRLLVVCWQYRRILHLLQDKALWPWVPLLDALYTLYYLVFAPALFNTGQSRQEKWKQ